MCFNMAACKWREVRPKYSLEDEKMEFLLASLATILKYIALRLESAPRNAR